MWERLSAVAGPNRIGPADTARTATLTAAYPVGVSKSPTPRPEPVANNAFERMSLPATRFLAKQPPAAPVIVVLVLVLVGGFIGPWGAIPLGLVVLFLLWMLALSWPRLTGPERLMRLAVVALVLALTVTKVFPR